LIDQIWEKNGGPPTHNKKKRTQCTILWTLFQKRESARVSLFVCCIVLNKRTPFSQSFSSFLSFSRSLSFWRYAQST
jgi:hypothetical protein